MGGAEDAAMSRPAMTENCEFQQGRQYEVTSDGAFLVGHVTGSFGQEDPAPLKKGVRVTCFQAWGPPFNQTLKFKLGELIGEIKDMKNRSPNQLLKPLPIQHG